MAELLVEPVIGKATADKSPHDEHEAFVMVNLDPPANEPSVVDAMSPNDTGNDGTNGTIHMQADDIPAEPSLSKGETKDKPAVAMPQPAGAETKSSSLSVKSPSKSSSAPPTPLVKKIINSGTFGTGTVKPAPKASTTTTKAATPASPIKKATSSPSAPPSKPAMAISKASSTGVSTTPSGSLPNKRASLTPKAPASPSTTRTALASSTSSKPPPSPAARAIISSPAGKSSSTVRPRASLSEAVKQPLARSKPISTKSSANNSPTASVRLSRATASISSIREIKEDGKLLEDLQKKLKETSASLESKSEAVTSLQVQVDQLNVSLETALADVESQKLAAAQLVMNSEENLKDAQAALNQLRAEQNQGSLTLQSVREELEAAKISASSQTRLIETLQTKIQVLEAEDQDAKKNLETLRAANESAVAEDALKHEALTKAKETLQAETEALKFALALAREETSKFQHLESEAALVETLKAELADSRQEKEDNAGKLSELEIEILELKESQEAAEDERGQLSSKIKSLEEELSKAIIETQQASEDDRTKEEEHAHAMEGLTTKHEIDLESVKSELASVVARLETLQAELTEAHTTHAKAQEVAQAAAEEHTRILEEMEKARLREQDEHLENIKKITVELEGQEAKYNAKVEIVKADYDRSLQEAFERAKNEAGAAHSDDLQTLRSESNTTIEQLRAVHQSAIDTLNAEHNLALEERVSILQKKIDDQSLDLKATQDDLAKAKAASESARSDAENIRTQLNEARAAAETVASASPEHLAEIERLNKDVSHAKDDLAAVTEMLDLTKTSLLEMSTNHSVELEEAAKGRAEEVTKLRTAHEQEMVALVTQKSELLTQLSDLEGELTIAKASITTDPTPSKSTGNGAAHISSPGVTKEELQQMHEAHNLKLHDLQSEHDRAIKALQEKLEDALSSVDNLQQEVGRKAMEIQYLEQDQEENQDQITRLKEDLETAAGKLMAQE